MRTTLFLCRTFFAGFFARFFRRTCGAKNMVQVFFFSGFHFGSVSPEATIFWRSFCAGEKRFEAFVGFVSV